MSGRLLACLTLAATVALGPACGEPEPADDPRSARWTEARASALGYLRSTRTELGLDVVVALQIVGELAEDRAALDIADARRAELSEEDVLELGRLFDLPKPVLPPASISAADAPAAVPSPGAPPPEGAPDVADCLVEALTCEASSPCTELGMAEGQWGYVLTHQAVWLLFLRWAGCDTSVDLDDRRVALAAALAAEMTFDPVMTDLAAERLAMLGHMGFAASIEDEWIDLVLDAQEPNGCWRLGPGLECHPHVTGVALWALAVSLGPG
ncbi:MAG: DUF4735 domain-containing protein [Deltaproteobacteria bacterium]|nr:DUF4735 domain-containing protein [Deltaproteobacteria bacterium]